MLYTKNLLIYTLKDRYLTRYLIIIDSIIASLVNLSSTTYLTLSI
jgi:hypothetical protein